MLTAATHRKPVGRGDMTDRSPCKRTEASRWWEAA